MVTVPAYFTKAQKKATMDACKIAGLECLRLISEPTAASIAYRLKENDAADWDDRAVLVFDFGGGTLDVSILNIVDYSMEVCSTSGNTFLGGRDFDKALYELCNERLKAELDINLGVMQEQATTSQEALRDACEKAKKELSVEGVDTATITLTNINGSGRDFSTVVTLAEFNNCIAKFTDDYLACMT